MSSHVREAIIKRDGGICAYCGWEADQVDHIVPWSYGGSDDGANLVACCGICNMIANDKVFDSFDAKRTYVQLRYGPFMEGRLRRIRRTLSWCPDCQNVFSPRVGGSSAVLCAECYRRDGEET